MDDTGREGAKWTDAHFCSLPSQSNVYGLTKLTGTGEANRILVACIEGKVTSIEYQKNQNKITPITREVPFTYIPADAEIVSLDAYYNKGVVIGISFHKGSSNESKPDGNFLNIYYSELLGEQEMNLDVVAHECQIITLSFTPYQLLHTQVYLEGQRVNNAFLLLGSDCGVHMYQYDDGEHKFVERSLEKFFPELVNTPSIPWKMDIYYFDNFERRLTTVGHQNGLVRVALVDVTTLSVLQTWTVEHDSPVSCVQIFPPVNHVPMPSFLEALQDENSASNGEKKAPIIYSLLVTSTLGVAVVYRDILHCGLSDVLTLPDSDKLDCVMAACVLDIDFDGVNEILIGTYGQQLLAYKYITLKGIPMGFKEMKLPLDANLLKKALLGKNGKQPTARYLDFDKHRHRSNEADKISMSPREVVPRRVKSQEDIFRPDDKDRGATLKMHRKSCDAAAGAEEIYEGYQLIWHRGFAGPVMGLDVLDVMGDGMLDLIVMTLKGLHILQPDLNVVANVLMKRLRKLADGDDAADADDPFTKLQQETFGR